ncbi:Ribosome biogenesis protein enp2, partial [Grifola frondosa]
MVALPDPSAVKVYTVNGAASGSSSSLPDWLTRKRAIAGKGKRAAIREQVEGSLELIQHFEFPEASNRVKTTRDGHHTIATGVYKPQMRVWDLDQLSLKFERHSDAENVDFIMLSDDWTKSIHLQNDRSIELHSQGGLHYSTRIPRFGRALAYHFPPVMPSSLPLAPKYTVSTSIKAAFLTLSYFREIVGVNTIDINPAHQLFAFGIEGNGTVEFWDPRSRARVGILRLPVDRLMPVAPPPLPGIEEDAQAGSLSVTAIASRQDGLSYAIGTSTGHTLLYDIRSARHVALKDQGYGLPVKNVSWIEGGSRMAGDGLILSADKKVIKIWDRSSPETNFTSITPASDINDVHHIPGSGLLLLANEGIRMTTYFIPQLGPAPRWCSFLENLTEEMEDQTTRTAYQDYKFVERSELTRLGLDHLIGTPALKPYMHGYFLSLQLYDTARVIANPYAYAEHREEKMEKMAESRIRARKVAGVKVNKALAEKIRKEDERARKREERRAAKKAEAVEHNAETMAVDEEAATHEPADGSEPPKEKPSLLSDPRFKALFENPEFQVDEESREFALLNPSSVAQRQNRGDAGKGRRKTAVEEEEEESERPSSDGLSDSEASKSGESEEGTKIATMPADDIRARMAARTSYRAQARTREPQRRNPNVRLVPLRTQDNTSSGPGADKNATFGQRRSQPGISKGKGRASASGIRHTAEGGIEMSWVPSSNAPAADADDVFGESTGKQGKGVAKRKGVEMFGAGMEKGGEEHEHAMTESERKGRTQRRKDMRSGSKNTFRKM